MRIHGQYLAFLMAPLLILSWICLAAFEPSGPNGILEYMIVGYVIGTMFAQTTLAGAWVALGPAPLLWRLPLSLAWIAAMASAFALNVGGNGPDAMAAIIMGVCMVGQWVLVQAPLWGLAIGYGLRLRHRSDPPETPRDRQFGIRQVMILTLIVAVFLAICRALAIRSASYLEQGDLSEIGVFGFLAVAGILMTLPLLLAALLPRWWLLGVPLVLALVGLLTWYELPLVNLVSGPGGGPDQWHLILINGFQSVWVLVVAGIVRACGYGMGQPGILADAGGSPFASSFR